MQIKMGFKSTDKHQQKTIKAATTLIMSHKITIASRCNKVHPHNTKFQDKCKATPERHIFQIQTISPPMGK